MILGRFWFSQFAFFIFQSNTSILCGFVLNSSAKQFKMFNFRFNIAFVTNIGFKSSTYSPRHSNLIWETSHKIQKYKICDKERTIPWKTCLQLKSAIYDKKNFSWQVLQLVWRKSISHPENLFVLDWRLKGDVLCGVWKSFNFNLTGFTQNVIEVQVNGYGKIDQLKYV